MDLAPGSEGLGSCVDDWISQTDHVMLRAAKSSTRIAYCWAVDQFLLEQRRTGKREERKRARGNELAMPCQHRVT